MRLFTLAAALLFSLNSICQTAMPIRSSRKIQVAFLFDASNSMDGLIDQAKSRIWKIINEVSILKHQGNTPQIEIAIYKYGHSALSTESNYIQQLTPLSTDLDVISNKLFSIKTNGGNEYCGAVIDKALNELNWSKSSSDLKMIYIAGNESFAQGPVDFRGVCNKAISNNIYINTIFCGNEANGISLKWKEAALLGQGDYFFIDTQQPLKVIETPYDAQINQYNDSLNNTYYSYGGANNYTKKLEQVNQDKNAASQAPSIKTERAIVKSKTTYTNSSWDIIDAVEEDEIQLSTIKEEALPQELKGKTLEEKNEFIENKKNERQLFQEKITDLAKERNAFIALEKSKSKEEVQDDFGTSISKSILEKASKLEFKQSTKE